MGIELVKLIHFEDTELLNRKKIELTCRDLGSSNAGGGITFKIRRIFYMYASDKNIVRGNHANRNTEFVLLNVYGKSKVKVDDGMRTKIYELADPNTGVYIPRMIWKEMYDFSEDSVLLCLASEVYDPSEYIRNYEEFKRAL